MLLGNGMQYNKIPLTLLGDRWQGFVRDERVLASTNDEGFTKLNALPNGYPPGRALIPPRKAGYARSNPRTEFGATAAGYMYGGVTTTGDSTFGIDTNTPDGQLIASVLAGGAPATFGIDTNTPALTASINGTGSTTISFFLDPPTLGAIASLIATAEIGVTGDSSAMLPTDDSSPLRTATANIGVTGDLCEMLPTNDSSPLRDASATFGFDGALTRYAVGHMEGSTADQGLTLDNIVGGVWNAALIDYAVNGSAGKALSTASSGGVDLDLMAQAILAAAQVTPIHSNMEQVNGEEVIGDGSELDPWRAVGVDP